MPRLAQREPMPAETLIYREHLSRNDVREIFRTLNRDGKLDSLKTFIESPSDAELDAMANLLSRYLYEDADRPDGAIRLLESHLRARSFTRWSSQLRDWSESPDFKPAKEALIDLIGQPGFSDLLQHDAGFFSPRQWETLATIASAAGEYRESLPWPTPEAIASRETVNDLQRFLASAPDRARLLALARTFEDEGFGTILFRALGEARGQRGSAAFEGFARGLSTMLGSAPKHTISGYRNKLELLARLARLLDYSSDGLFSTLQQKLLDQHQEPARQLTEFLRPAFLRGIAGVMRDRFRSLESQGRTHDKAFWLGLSSTPTPNPAYIALFSDLRDAVDSATKPPVPLDGEDHTGGILSRAPVLLNTLALTKWVEAIVRENAAQWGNLSPDGFAVKIWEQPTKSKGLVVSLIEPGSDPMKLSAQTLAEMKALGMETLGPSLGAIAAQEDPASLVYTFPALAADTSFAAAFRQAVLAADRSRPFANLAAVAVVLSYELTSPMEGRVLSLQALETPDILDELHRIISFSLPAWRRSEHLLFEDIGLGDLGKGMRDFLLGFYDGKPVLAKRAEDILDSVQMFYELDRPVRELPAPLELYQRVLGFSPPKKIHSLGALFSFLSDARFFATPGESPSPLYPAVYRFIENGRGAGRLLNGFASVDPHDRAPFLEALSQALSPQVTPSGMDLHLDALQRLLTREPDGVRAIFDHLHEIALPAALDPLSARSLDWGAGLLRRGDHRVLWNFLQRNGSRGQWLGLVRELRTLSAKGYLQDAFYILGHIRNERLQRIASVLGEWDRSGELAELLKLVETTVR